MLCAVWRLTRDDEQYHGYFCMFLAVDTLAIHLITQYGPPRPLGTLCQRRVRKTIDHATKLLETSDVISLTMYQICQSPSTSIKLRSCNTLLPLPKHNNLPRTRTWPLTCFIQHVTAASSEPSCKRNFMADTSASLERKITVGFGVRFSMLISMPKPHKRQIRSIRRLRLLPCLFWSILSFYGCSGMNCALCVN